MTRPAGAPAVVTAEESAALDRATIGAGTASLTLMDRAGEGAAAAVVARFGALLADGVRVYAGAGNNGGDGWVVARHLAGRGVPVEVLEVAEAKTADARAMRERALPGLTGDPLPRARVAIDALLGTGARGAPREPVSGAIERLRTERATGARIVALDVPSGLDATTGESHGACPADLTVSFGTVKRGQLVARAIVGELVVVDIGLRAPAAPLPELASAEWVRDQIPEIAADAHKGTRRKLAIVGGGEGMAGAAILAAQAALRSGIGMVRVFVHEASLLAVQTAVPSALAARWPSEQEAKSGGALSWADGVLIGPGLGEGDAARQLVERVLRGFEGPAVLDADALNVFRDEGPELGRQLRGRAALLTPHPAEAARLAGASVHEVLDRRFEVPAELAARTRAGVLLKGVPTVIAGVDGRTMVVARGTPALATAGSGDVLAGMAATLLTQLGDPLRAGACAAFVHGRAAELADPHRVTRGVDLGDIVRALGEAWRAWPARPVPPVLLELPAAGAPS